MGTYVFATSMISSLGATTLAASEIMRQVQAKSTVCTNVDLNVNYLPSLHMVNHGSPCWAYRVHFCKRVSSRSSTANSIAGVHHLYAVIYCAGYIFPSPGGKLSGKGELLPLPVFWIASPQNRTFAFRASQFQKKDQSLLTALITRET